MDMSVFVDTLIGIQMAKQMDVSAHIIPKQTVTLLSEWFIHLKYCGSDQP